jgi:hypothetical protein
MYKMKRGTNAVYWKDRGKCIFSSAFTSPQHQVIMWMKKEIYQYLSTWTWMKETLLPLSHSPVLCVIVIHSLCGVNSCRKCFEYDLYEVCFMLYRVSTKVIQQFVADH